MKKKLYIVKGDTWWFKEGEIVLQMSKPKLVRKENLWIIGADQQNVLDNNLERKNKKHEDGTAIRKADLILLDII